MLQYAVIIQPRNQKWYGNLSIRWSEIPRTCERQKFIGQQAERIIEAMLKLTRTLTINCRRPKRIYTDSPGGQLHREPCYKTYNITGDSRYNLLDSRGKRHLYWGSVWKIELFIAFSIIPIICQSSSYTTTENRSLYVKPCPIPECIYSITINTILASFNGWTGPPSMGVTGDISKMDHYVLVNHT